MDTNENDATFPGFMSTTGLIWDLVWLRKEQTCLRTSLPHPAANKFNLFEYIAQAVFQIHAVYHTVSPDLESSFKFLTFAGEVILHNAHRCDTSFDKRYCQIPKQLYVHIFSVIEQLNYDVHRSGMVGCKIVSILSDTLLRNTLSIAEQKAGNTRPSGLVNPWNMGIILHFGLYYCFFLWIGFPPPTIRLYRRLFLGLFFNRGENGDHSSQMVDL